MTKIEALEEVLAEYNHAKKLKRLNEELMEHLNSTARWILHYCEKNDMELKNIQSENNTMKSDLLELKKGTKIIEYLKREYEDKAKDISND